MVGVTLSEGVDEELKNKLGLEFNSKISFLWGVSYPLPDWYSDLSFCQKFLWWLYRRFGELMTTLLFISNLVMVCKAYNDIRVFTTCLGTMTYIICVCVKLSTFNTHKKTLKKVFYLLHVLSGKLDENPLKDDNFFKIHHQYYHHVKFFGIGKNVAITSGVCTLALYNLIHGLFQTKPEDRHLPMFGWFPYNSYMNPQFSFSCCFQLVSYLSFLLKDVVIDLIFLTVLVVLNTHLIYLKHLLEKMLRSKDSEDELNWQMKWWIEQHQLVLRIIEKFKKISSPYLFMKYISVSIILFLGGVLVTTSKEWDLVQQTIVLAINLSNLLQLYIFSIMGDMICQNGHEVTRELNSGVFTKSKRIQNAYLHIVTRTTKPILIQFGSINPLSAESFGKILKMTFSYFITIVQLRAESNMTD